MGKILAVCISEKRGTAKKDVGSATLVPDFGISNDAHAGHWHRQVSLLSDEKIQAFKAKGANVNYGDFGENIVVSGIDLRALPVGTLLKSGNIVLEITQIGKECHSHCNIYKQVGDCIMPREGVFAKVIVGGTISVGDDIEVTKRSAVLPYRAAVVTLSDKGFKKEREDKSGPAIVDYLKQHSYEIIEQILLPDDRVSLQKELIRLCDQRMPDLIITTGGTGFSPRDITPEATLAISERNAPGIAEAIRAYSMKITPRAMLSRGVSVIRKKTLIINLPGSPKACLESLDCIIDVIPHGIDVLRGNVNDCANK